MSNLTNKKAQNGIYANLAKAWPKSFSLGTLLKLLLRLMNSLKSRYSLTMPEKETAQKKK